MEIHHEVVHYIAAHNRMTQVELARHFGWSNTAKHQWIEALRGWGWIEASGRVRLTEKGREALERMNDARKC